MANAAKLEKIKNKRAVVKRPFFISVVADVVTRIYNRKIIRAENL